ncbi:alpha/beta hydrolase family protein [Streptomyces aurantiacus]|nr:alpha/beta hydrolase [Streptomyces aurantiacus]
MRSGHLPLHRRAGGGLRPGLRRTEQDLSRRPGDPVPARRLREAVLPGRGTAGRRRSGSAVEGRRVEGRDLFLRAAAICRIARFPVNRSPLGQEAWEKGKAAYEQGGRLLDPPSIPIGIPFTHADTAAGDLDADIAAYLRLPQGQKPATGWPVVLCICGLDAYRTDHTPRTQQHVDRGYATISFEIPGTGDCPAAPNDPASPDRLMSSVLDWVAAGASAYGFNPERILARGISTGGYYAFRIAHTHADRLFAVVAQGGGCHHMFDADWIGAQNQMEYPFALSDALAYKFGYRDPDPAVAVARYAAEAHKFSLADSGILRAPTCKLLVVNGTHKPDTARKPHAPSALTIFVTRRSR